MYNVATHPFLTIIIKKNKKIVILKHIFTFQRLNVRGGELSLKRITIVILFLILLGFQSLMPGQSIASKTGGASSMMKNSKQEHFLAALSLPQKVNINEEFTIKADLKKETEKKLIIASRKQMFVYVIKDSSGKQINSNYTISDVGKNRIISGKAVISEVYKYKIKEPGIYEVSAIAEFTVMNDGKSEEIVIETDPKTIEIAID